MSVPTTTHQPSEEPASVPWTATVASEWIKLTSTRSTWVTLAVGTGLAVAISALLAVVVGSTWDDWDASARADFDPVMFPLAGSIAVGIALNVLAVKVVSNEYASEMMRVTLTATPRRDRVLLAKLLVVFGVTLVVGLVATVAMFLACQAIYSSYDLETASLLDNDAVRMTLGSTVTGLVFPLLGAAFAFLFRNSAGAITAVLASIFAPAIVGAMLPDWWQRNVLAYLPGAAADSIAVGHLDTESTYASPLGGALALVAWSALALLTAHLALTRRDA